SHGIIIGASMHDDAMLKVVIFHENFTSCADHNIPHLIPLEAVLTDDDILHHFPSVFEINSISWGGSAVALEAVVFNQPALPDPGEAKPTVFVQQIVVEVNVCRWRKVINPH